MKALLIFVAVISTSFLGYYTVFELKIGGCSGVSDAMQDHLNAPSTKIDCKEATRYEKDNALPSGEVSQGIFEGLTLKKAWDVVKEVRGVI